MIELLEEQNELLRELLSKERKELINTPVEKRIIKPRTSVKLDQATQWLLDHPEFLISSGRVLENNGLGISYKTWNEAKKRIGHV